MKGVCLGAVVALLVLAVGVSAFQYDDCSPCQFQHCLIPHDCEAGIVKDRCGCCNICAKKEFELCEHPQVGSREYLGKCGDNLECRLRADVDAEGQDPPEAICHCTLGGGVMCGSDDVTYENLCQLAAASVVKKQKLTIKNKGACKQAPVMVSPPDHAKDMEGADIALVCEVQGFPIPTVEWTWTHGDGETVFLPSDDFQVSVNMRGGPERSQITGWLQIMDVKKAHEGDYTCIAQNELGVVQASARVNVIEDAVKQAQKKRRKDKRPNNF